MFGSVNYLPYLCKRKTTIGYSQCNELSNIQRSKVTRRKRVLQATRQDNKVSSLNKTDRQTDRQTRQTRQQRKAKAKAVLTI